MTPATRAKKTPAIGSSYVAKKHANDQPLIDSLVSRGCTVWDKEKRWEYYKNPAIATMITRYMDNKCKDQDDCIIETELISTSGKKWINHKPLFNVKDQEGSAVERMEQLGDKDLGGHSGAADLFVRLTKTPATKMLDLDVSIPKDQARDVAKAIEEYMADRDLDPVTYFTGKTGYHIEYHDHVEDLRQAETLVDDIVENVQPEFPGITITKATTHPPANSVAIDWSRCSSASEAPGKKGTTCLVPFSLRWDSCLASVPVNFLEFPDFDPERDADPNYILQHVDRFT